MAYATLFLSAFLSATLLPGSSEALLFLYARSGYDLWGLWAVATVANTLGSVVNYAVGRAGEVWLERHGKLTAKQAIRAKKTMAHYGGLALLLSWVPVIGDALTLLAGALHYPLGKFVSIVAIAKGGRYAAILLFWQALT